MAGETSFGLRPLAETDSFTSIRPGGEAFLPLKTFARKHAKAYEAQNLARTYVVEDEGVGRIAAYVTLLCSEVVSKAAIVEAEDLHFPYDTFPAVKIVRLLVDERYRAGGFGFGRLLVNFSLGLAHDEVCPAVGCRFVVVEAKGPSVGFYERCGFTLLDTEANRQRSEPVMYVDLHKTSAGVASA